MAGTNRKADRLNEAKYSYTDERTIKDAAKVYVGEMIQSDSNLEVLPATAVSGVIVLGISTEEVDNTDDGEVTKDISTAIHKMDQAGDITKASIGAYAYVVDAATVSVSAASDATTNIAGPIVDVPSATEVYIDFDPAKKV